MRVDVTVIGGGLAGLTAAVLAAQEGLQVLVVERAGQMGGRAVTTDLQGALLNIGPHALYRKGAAYAILRRLGFVAQGRSPKLRGGLVRGGVLHPIQNIAGVLLLKFLTWRERWELLRTLLRPARAEQGESLQTWMERTIRSENVRQLYAMQVRLSSYANAPELVGAASTLAQMRRASGGVLYLDGGWQSMVDFLQQKALAAGVAMRTNAQVTAVERCGGQYHVQLADGTQVLSRTVVSTAAPRETARWVVGAEAPTLQGWQEKLQPVQGAALDVVLRGLPRPEVSFALDIERPLYYANHSATARLSDDPELQVVHVFNYLHPQDKTPAAEVRAELEQFLDLLQPGWKERVHASRFLPTLTVTQGLMTTAREQQRQQETPHVPELPGLFLAGDWLATEGLLADAAVASARAAIREVIAHLRVAQV